MVWDSGGVYWEIIRQEWGHVEEDSKVENTTVHNIGTFLQSDPQNCNRVIVMFRQTSVPYGGGLSSTLSYFL